MTDNEWRQFQDRTGPGPPQVAERPSVMSANTTTEAGQTCILTHANAIHPNANHIYLIIPNP